VDYVRLGATGLKVSRICLGMMSYGSKGERAWHLTETEAEPLVRAAAESGVTFFDTADMYSGGLTPVPDSPLGPPDADRGDHGGPA
jgi:aryl-alcohol dehydrogenase-like predicted oxidoreductase